MNQVIILEGPDGAGKTTLAKRLCADLGARYVHEGPPPADVCALQYYATKLVTYLRQSKPVVLDRFYLGEHVYGPVARDKDRLGKIGLRMMRRLCEGAGVREVFCLPPWHQVRRNYADKLAAGDDYLLSEQKLYEVFKRYESLLRLDHKEVYDYTQAYRKFDWHPSLVLPEIEFRRTYTLPRGASGSVNAKLLLVGERSNSGLDVPFTSLTGSSRYLDEALQEAGIPEEHLAFVNAYEPAVLLDRPRGAHPRSTLLRRTAARLANPYVVALGRESQDALIASKVPWHAHLPHPSSHKRFSYKVRHQYAEMLRACYETALKGTHD